MHRQTQMLTIHSHKHTHTHTDRHIFTRRSAHYYCWIITCVSRVFIYCCLWCRRRRQEKLIHTGAYGRPTAIESSRSIHTPYVTYTALAKLTRSVCSLSAKKIRTHVQSVHMHFERMHAMRNVFETSIHFNSTEMIHHTYSSLHSGVDGIYTFFSLFRLNCTISQCHTFVYLKRTFFPLAYRAQNAMNENKNMYTNLYIATITVIVLGLVLCPEVPIANIKQLFLAQFSRVKRELIRFEMRMRNWTKKKSWN